MFFAYYCLGYMNAHLPKKDWKGSSNNADKWDGKTGPIKASVSGCCKLCEKEEEKK